eukprot:408782_1
MDVDRIESDNSNDPLTFEERGLMLWNNELSQLDHIPAAPSSDPQPVQPVQPQLNQPAASPLDHQQPSPAPLDHQPRAYNDHLFEVQLESSFNEDVIGIVRTHFQEYLDIDMITSDVFVEYYWNLVRQQGVYSRGNGVYIMQTYNVEKQAFVPGKYFHVRKWGTDLLCACNEYRNTSKCVHGLIVKIVDRIADQSINMVPFMQETQTHGALELVTDRRGNLRGKQIAIYSVKNQIKRYGIVNVNDDHKVFCSSHKTKKCEHRGAVRHELKMEDDDGIDR